MQFFYLQQEGAVRTVALSLLRSIFEQHKIPETQQEKIYDCMIYAILKDADKAVKLTALSFWDLVIRKQLEHEGMIDGGFPKNTFSKVYKKIITFDDATIAMCLLRVLQRVSELGGIYVFLHIFQTEIDEEIINAAIKYITRFADLLSKYNIVSSKSFKPDYFHFVSPNCGPNIIPVSQITDRTNSGEEVDSTVNCQRQNVYTDQRSDLTAFVEFLRNFDYYCDKRPRKNGRSDDLETVLNKIFIA